MKGNAFGCYGKVDDADEEDIGCTEEDEKILR
jgi:hypothetical protein